MKTTTFRFTLGMMIAAMAVAFIQQVSYAQDAAPAAGRDKVLKIYGPGGPAPAMREAAKIFGEKKGVKIEVTPGPTPNWKDQALKDADMIFSGAEFMMTDFIRKDLPGLIDPSSVRTLYLRPSAILVRPGNPRNIKGVKDLARQGVKTIVVQGAGQTGMWEDVAGRTGDVRLVDGIRRNIGSFSANSAEAKKLWNSDKSYDAWLIWTIWQKESPASADLIATEKEHTVYRSCGIAVTNRSENKALAGEFADFIQSAAGQDIFAAWGWLKP